MRLTTEDAEAHLQLLLEALTAVKEGDFSVRLPRAKDNLMDQIAQAFNDVIERDETLAKEIVRVSKTIGEEGKLTERTWMRDACGMWANKIEAINTLIGSLAQQTTEVGRVITAVAQGDLSKKMILEIEGRPVKGDFLRIGIIVNAMVDQMSLFAAEVTRVAKEVGTEGKLGGQAEVKGVAGTWKDLTDNVNAMASNLTVQLRDVSKVATAIANGDLAQKITVDVKGEILQIKDMINKMVDQLSSFAGEVSRVAKEVGTEGKLGGQAVVKGVAGVWKDLTENVNAMASNLTVQLRDVSKVATAIANGDLTQKITVDVKGEILQIKDVTNKMVDQLNSFAGEVTRVAKEVGTEGKLGGQAVVKGVAGIWKDLTDNVNAMASNLTVQLRDVSKVATAIASGDLTQKITVEVKGEILQIKDVINKMVDQLNSFASEVTRVAREVGTEGKLGGQAEVRGVAGTWKDLTENVNAMASNLTVQLRDVSKVATAIANGDLTQKITVDVKGEILQIKDVTNKMVDQLNSFAAEVTRVAKEVGTEGKLGVQADVKGVAGTWKGLTDNVNAMAGNLTVQLRDVSKVATAIASGDLTQTITVDVKGEILQIKDVINKMVGQLNSFASEVTRVAKEVGTEGKLGGQAEVKGVAGIWKNLTDNVNAMATSLTSQVRDIARVTTAVAHGKLDQKITVEAEGEILELKNTINGMVDNLSTIIGDVNSVMAMVGDGTLTRLIEVEATGEFASMVEGINGTIQSLRGIVTELTDAGVNIGSASQTLLSAGQEMNAMVTQLSGSMEQIAGGAKAQAQQIAEASRESEGVGNAASNTLARAQGMNQMAEVANRAAGEGGKAMEATIKNTDLMLQGSQESVLSIESLSKSSEQIQAIVDVIRDIATQTNILAINAAIEAVRAGKQGKGFAVVAEEVKTLSGESKDQAKKISSLVQSVLKETQDAVTTIKTMAENVTMGKQSIEETSKAFTDINCSIDSTSRTAKDISEAAGEQKASIDAISQSLDKISGIAADTSTASTQSAAGAKRLLAKMQELTTTATTLASMSENFSHTVGRFTIEEEDHRSLGAGRSGRSASPSALFKALKGPRRKFES